MKAHIQHNSDANEYYFEEGCYINEWWNSEKDQSVSIARARVAPGEVTRRHRLLAASERYVILAGRGRVEVGDLPPAEVVAGDVVMIPPEVDQRIANIGEQDLVFLAICSPRFTPDCYRDTEELRKD